MGFRYFSSLSPGAVSGQLAERGSESGKMSVADRHFDSRQGSRSKWLLHKSIIQQNLRYSTAIENGSGTPIAQYWAPSNSIPRTYTAS
jgi:hypothetical protein